MSSFRQIDANRRNARLSTGPFPEEGKRKSRQNAVRHGLTAETVIDALEDAEDYAAFELAVTADYDAQSTVERELVLRLASLLWRLRRATAIESGLFKIQAKHLLQFRQRRQADRERPKIIDGTYRNAPATEEDMRQDDDERRSGTLHPGPSPADPSDDLTRSFVRLSNLPTYPLDRLSRYEATLLAPSLSGLVHAAMSRPPQGMGKDQIPLIWQVNLENRPVLSIRLDRQTFKRVESLFLIWTNVELHRSRSGERQNQFGGSQEQENTWADRKCCARPRNSATVNKVLFRSICPFWPQDQIKQVRC